jgi:hypothetical protein
MVSAIVLAALLFSCVVVWAGDRHAEREHQERIEQIRAGCEPVDGED